MVDWGHYVCCPQLLVEGLRQMCLQERAAASGEARSYSALTQAPSEWEEVVRGLGTSVIQCPDVMSIRVPQGREA